MMAWAPRPGCTLRIPSGPSGDHLFVVVIGPRHIQTYGPHGLFLLVPICSIRPDGKHDRSCILQTSDHRFVRHESYLDFSKPRVLSESDLIQRVMQRLFIPDDDVGAVLLARMTAGLSESLRTPLYILDEFVPR